MVMNPELRRNARQQLGDNIFSTAWLMMLLACFVQAAIIGAASFTYIGALILFGPLSYGLMRCMVNVIEGKNKTANISDLFCGFTENFTHSFILGLLMSLFISLWSMLLVIPGIVKAYSYSMAFYIQQKDSNKDWKYCLDTSISMMNGHRMQLFLLDLSFIGWYLLGSLCFGIGTLFVAPYHNMARVNFFEALAAEKGYGVQEPVEEPVEEMVIEEVKEAK